MKDEERCLVTGIVPGCVVMFMQKDDLITAKVVALHTKGENTKVVCVYGSKIVQIPIEECQLHRAFASKLAFNVNGEVVAS